MFSRYCQCKKFLHVFLLFGRHVFSAARQTSQLLTQSASKRQTQFKEHTCRPNRMQKLFNQYAAVLVMKVTGRPKLTAIVQSCRLTLLGHTVRMDDNADTKRILSTLLPEDWRRPRGRPRITWLSTIQQDLRSHNLTLPEPMDMAQNQSLWRTWSTYGATQS